METKLDASSPAELPHTSRHFVEEYPPMPAADVIVVATCVIAALVLAMMALMGWLS